MAADSPTHDVQLGEIGDLEASRGALDFLWSIPEDRLTPAEQHVLYDARRSANVLVNSIEEREGQQ